MRYSIVFSTALVAGVSGHGIIRNIVGANNVSMPGLGIADGTPRDCAVNACGSQADTSIIRDSEIWRGRSPLGWNQGHGDVNPETVVAAFMGRGDGGPNNKGASGATGKEDDLASQAAASKSAQRREEHMHQMRSWFSGLFNFPVIGILGLGGQLNDYPKETLIQDTYGQGAKTGLPTTDDNGEIGMIYRQINQDGAGPLTASIDPSSGGKSYGAFLDATVSLNMPGLGIGGLSLATNTDFTIKVRMPEGMTCEGEIAGVKNVCVVRVRNQALAGPFGGSGAFVQNEKSRKRAVAYRLKKRYQIKRDSE